jgi:3-deoxy-manno-octulosonate cytidylyltransferase (CMP-KDO synthetase)
MGDVLVVIPARWGSSRFPGKALADLAGRPLVVRVADLASRMATATRVVVATDDERIAAAVRAAGHLAEMTGEHATGSDRVGEVAARHDAEVVVNLQGDEPLLDPAGLDDLVAALRADPRADLATLAHPFRGPEEWQDPHAVKVLTAADGRALWFSRAPLPGGHPGDAGGPHWRLARRHVGVYAYRAAALRRFLELPPTDCERAEGLEQLRALEHGLRVLVVGTAAGAVGVDTPADLERVRAAWGRPG